MEKNARWFSAGALIRKDKSDGVWKVLARTSDQDPTPRFLGGCEEDGDVSPVMTLGREFLDESQRYKPLEYEEAFLQSNPGHDKRVYLLLDVEGEIDFSYKAEVKEPDGEIIFVSWMPFQQFKIRARGFHQKAIKGVVEKLMIADAQFSMDHAELIPQ